MSRDALRIILAAKDVLEFRGDALILPLTEEDMTLPERLKTIDAALQGSLSLAIRRKAFCAKVSERYLLRPAGRLRVEQALLLGLGKASELTQNRVREATAEALRHLRACRTRRTAIAVDHAHWGGLPAETVTQAIAEGALLGLYRFNAYKWEVSEEGGRDIESLTLLCIDHEAAGPLKRAIRRGEVMARSTNLARDLVNEPANILTPAELATRARGVARQYGMGVKALNQDAMRRLRMGALLGVAQGSANTPQLIIQRQLP